MVDPQYQHLILRLPKEDLPKPCNQRELEHSQTLSRRFTGRHCAYEGRLRAAQTIGGDGTLEEKALQVSGWLTAIMNIFFYKNCSRVRKDQFINRSRQLERLEQHPP